MDITAAQKRSIALMETPLGKAWEAIDTAMQEICEALDAADIRHYSHCDPELTPDEDSVGFKLVLSFPEDIGPDAREVEKCLHDLLKKHGVATVIVLGTNIDPVEVK